MRQQRAAQQKSNGAPSRSALVVGGVRGVVVGKPVNPKCGLRVECVSGKWEIGTHDDIDDPSFYCSVKVVILTIVGDWGNQCALLSRTDCFWFVWTTPLRR